MSTITQNADQANLKSFNRDTTKTFVWDNRFANATFKNNTGSAAEFAEGTILARDSSDNSIVPLDSATATNGVNIPIGVLAQDLAEVANAGTVTGVYFCISGDVVRSKAVFQGSDTFTTVVATRTLEDHFLSQGIRFIGSTENTKFDN